MATAQYIYGETKPVNRRSAERRRAPGRRRSDRIRARRARRISNLVMVLVFSLVGLAGYFTYKNTAVSEISWASLFFNPKIKEKGFQIGGVTLGMTPAMIGRLHSNLEVSTGENGEKKGSYASGGAFYNLKFIGTAGDYKAYRLRYDQAFSTIPQTEILDSISRKHGNPATSDCVRSIAKPATRCHFRWWPDGGVVLDVYIAEIDGLSGQTRTEVSVLAVDMNLEGKRLRRLAKQSEGRRPIKLPDGGAGKESLPF